MRQSTFLLTKNDKTGEGFSVNQLTFGWRCVKLYKVADVAK